MGTRVIKSDMTYPRTRQGLRAFRRRRLPALMPNGTYPLIEEYLGPDRAGAALRVVISRQAQGPGG